MKRAIAVATMLALATPAWAKAEYDEDVEQAAQQDENPLSGTATLQFRNLTNYLIGPYERSSNVLQLRPRLPLRLCRWLTVNTFIIVPLAWVPDATAPRGSAFGMGDATLTLPFTHTFLDWIFVGIGPTMRFPTSASDGPLGGFDSGKYSLGPDFELNLLPGHFVIGLTVANVWSVGGRDSGRDVNAFSMTPVVTWNLPLGYYLTTQTAIAADWTTPTNDNRWVVSWGGGVGAVKLLTKKVAISYEVQAFWNVVRPDGGALWTLRFQASIIFPRLSPRL
jgi:hypothetical protein